LRNRAALRIVEHKRGLFWKRPIQVDAQGEASLRTWFGAVTCLAPAADIDVGSSRSYCTPIDERQLTLRKGPLQKSGPNIPNAGACYGTGVARGLPFSTT